MSNINRDLKVKVLVVGDPGVGKSSLAHLIATGEPTKNPGYTIGCSTQIKLHEFKQGTLDEKTFCVEIWDVGASKSHACSRSIFYNNVNGLILVHDLTNNKSLLNVPKWLNDVLDHEISFGLSSVKVSQTSSPLNHSASNEDNSSNELRMPVLMVGTKLDLLHHLHRRDKMRKGQDLSEQLKCSGIFLDVLNPKHLTAGSGNSVELSRFFDKTIEQAQLQNKINPPERWNTQTDHRKRSLRLNSKSSHLD